MERNLIAREIDDLAGLRQYEKPIPAKPLFKFVPANKNSLVFNRRELPNGIPGLFIENWRMHPKMHNDVVGNLKQKPRARNTIFQLAVHETATKMRSEGKAPGYAPSSPDYASSHLSVTRSGKVLQFDDLYQHLNHVGLFNTHAIGIEFVNQSWLPAAISGNKKDYPEGNDFIHCFWGDTLNIYRVPPDIKQLEVQTALIRFFLIDVPAVKAHYSSDNPTLRNQAAGILSNWFGIPAHEITTDMVDDLIAIDRNWLQVISADMFPRSWKPVKGSKFPDISDKSKKSFFAFTKAYNLLTFKNMNNARGVFGHGAFVTNSKHIDGSFNTLYSWLRIEKNYVPKDALHIAKVLVKNHPVLFRDSKHSGSLIALLDVRDEILEAAKSELFPPSKP